MSSLPRALEVLAVKRMTQWEKKEKGEENCHVQPSPNAQLLDLRSVCVCFSVINTDVSLFPCIIRTG
jgi:hypothetical protein